MAKPEKFGMAVFVFVFNKDFSKILLVKRNEEKKRKYGFYWGTVGGKIELGEFSDDGIIREAEEEIGVNLDKDKIRMLFVKEFPNFLNIVHSVIFFYGAVIDEHQKITINEESDGYQWFDVNKLPEDRSPDDDISYILKVAKEKFRFRG
jgi:8-oxo-dGTP diphosphatase